MNSLGVAIITLNEEAKIKEVLESVDFAKDIVIVDSGSTDNTLKIAKEKSVKIIYKAWSGYASQKQFAVDQLINDYILVLDADEVLTEASQIEIKDILAKDDQISGYKIPRNQYFLGKIMYFGKGYDSPIRLFKNNKGKFDNRKIHESIIIEGETTELKAGMIHYSGITILSRLKKISRDLAYEFNHYSCEVSLVDLFIGPIKTFWFNFFKREAYKDGWRGLVLTILFVVQFFIHNIYYFIKNIFSKK